MEDINHFFISLDWLRFFLIAIILGIVELLSFTTYFLWLAIAALLTGFISVIIGITWQSEFIIFSILCIPAIFLAYYFGKSLEKNNVSHNINQRTKSMIGTICLSVNSFKNGSGKIYFGDTEWLAKDIREHIQKPIQTNEQVKIVSVQGTVLLVEPILQKKTQ